MKKLRFIPTGVGNGRNDNRRYMDRPVHPHGRGERTSMERIMPIKTGSSPRAWGTD